MITRLLQHLNIFVKNEREKIQSVGIISFFSVASTAVGFGKTILLTNSLSKESYGSLGYVAATVGLMDLLAYPGIRMALLQYASLGHAGLLRYACAIHTKRFLLLLIPAIIFGYLFFLPNESNEVQKLFWVMVFIIPCITILRNVDYYLIGNGKYVFQAGLGLVISFTTAFMILILTIGFNVNNVVVFYISDSISQILLLGFPVLFYIYKEKNAKLPHDVQKDFLKYATQQSYLNVLDSLRLRLDKIIIGKMLPLSVLADFAIGEQIVAQLKAIWQAYYNSSYRKLAKKFSEEKIQWLSQKKELFILMVFFGFLVLGLIILLPIFLPWAFSEKYQSSSSIVSVLLIAFWLIIPGFMVELQLRARELIGEQYFMRGSIFIATLIILPVLIFAFGEMGAAMSRIFISLVFGIAGYIVMIRLKKGNEYRIRK